MQYTGRFTYETKVYETFNLPDTTRGERTSHVWVCTRCGRIFARLEAFDFANRRKPFQPYSGVCRVCPPRFGFTPGSVFTSWDMDLVRALPTEVVQRELLLQLDEYERMNNE